MVIVVLGLLAGLASGGLVYGTWFSIAAMGLAEPPTTSQMIAGTIAAMATVQATIAVVQIVVVLS